MEKISAFIGISLLVLSKIVSAQHSYSPYVNEANRTNVYCGDTHVHTNLSSDAYINGNTTLGPNEVYQFAKGQTITTDDNQKARLQKPLDFIVVADHAKHLGIMMGLETADPRFLNTDTGKQLLLYQHLLV